VVTYIHKTIHCINKCGKMDFLSKIQ